jgi:hypothetical protein
MKLQSRTHAPHAVPFPTGQYLTDGTALFAVVGELPQAPTLRLVEHCSTLDVLIISIEDLRMAGMRPVRRMSDAAEHEATTAREAPAAVARV